MGEKKFTQKILLFKYSKQIKILLLGMYVVNNGLVASDLRAVFLGLTTLGSASIPLLSSSSESKI